MTDDKSPRMDKLLWSLRLFKTRTLAMEACKKGRVMIGNIPVKPSRTIRPGEIIRINKLPVVYSFKIIAIPKSRLPAKLVPEYMEDITPQEELNKLQAQDTFFIKRDKGSGRPTKKDRRIIDKLSDY